ncbi:septum site-determining protein Ssd [Actinokineospora sp.]|uniref:septum site-determining protein Ssd n=1 Tax=Actinokineospora sp. TaxID=1872133 RepID=UPI0040382238
MSRPVACVHEDTLLDEVLRLAAAAGCAIERAADVTDIRARWHGAPLVLLDERAARACLTAALPRRESVVVVCSGTPPASTWELAVSLGAQRVLTLPQGESWLVGALADAIEAPAGQVGRVVAVMGGRGGAGASVFAAAIGLSALDLGHNALLVDCDPLGGGLDLVLGAEEQPGLRWPDLRLKSGRVPVSSLHSALPGRTKGNARLTLLSGAREGEGPSPDAVAAVVAAGKRAGETVICDVPRSPGEVAHIALDRADLAVVVLPAEVRACAAARRVATHLLDRGVRAEVVVRGPARTRLSPIDVAAAVGLPLLASIRPDAALSQSLDNGTFRLRPRSPLGRAARAVLRALPDSPRVPSARQP